MSRRRADLLIVYDQEGWAYHRRALALARHAPAGLAVELAAQTEPGLGLERVRPDVVLMLNYVQAARVRHELDRRQDDALLVTSFNTGWPRRRELLAVCGEVSDAVIVVNRETWERAGRLPGTWPIAHGVDLDRFRVLRPPAARRPRVLWSGSVYHRELKGYDELLVPLARRLEREGIETSLLLVDSSRPAERRSCEEMVRWYNGGTVYVCASSVEGTPNPVFEAAACGCVVVSTPVGSVPELVVSGSNGLLVERDLDALHAGVREALRRYPELVRASLASIAEWGWERRSRDYFTLIDRLRRASPTRLL
ncbi:MAG: glycosyltransferase [Thermoanaerobaculia bacterium]|nr:glycosyltransferase [Thermoanaerobaculia bacterium]